jgi:hypothetical protein
MMIESEHMIIGDDIGGADGGEYLEIPLPDVESMTNPTRKQRLWMWWRSISQKGLCLWIPRFFRYM